MSSDLEKLKARLAEIEKERAALQYAIGLLEGDTPPPPAIETAGGEPDSGADKAKSGPAPLVGRPDEFFGMSQHQAARAYLKKLGHADHIDKITRAVQSGGVEVGGAKPAQTMRAVLQRNTATFVRVGSGTFGLREFYPGLKEAKAERRKPRKKGTKSGNGDQGDESGSENEQRPPGPILAAVE